jgi:hypothetical protein
MAIHHIFPYIGKVKLKRLTADELDDWLEDRAEVLSTRSLRLIHLSPTEPLPWHT